MSQFNFLVSSLFTNLADIIITVMRSLYFLFIYLLQAVFLKNIHQILMPILIKDVGYMHIALASFKEKYNTKWNIWLPFIYGLRTYFIRKLLKIHTINLYCCFGKTTLISTVLLYLLMQNINHNVRQDIFL